MYIREITDIFKLYGNLHFQGGRFWFFDTVLVKYFELYMFTAFSVHVSFDELGLISKSQWFG